MEAQEVVRDGRVLALLGDLESSIRRYKRVINKARLGGKKEVWLRLYSLNFIEMEFKEPLINTVATIQFLNAEDISNAIGVMSALREVDETFPVILSWLRDWSEVMTENANHEKKDAESDLEIAQRYYYNGSINSARTNIVIAELRLGLAKTISDLVEIWEVQ